MPKKIILCYVCKKGGEGGPLKKVSNFDYAHMECFIEKGLPNIGNRSFMFKPTDKEIMETLKDVEKSKNK